jgi:hypothetical protein
MAATLNTSTTIEQRGVVGYLWAKNMDAAKDMDKEILPSISLWISFASIFLPTKTHKTTLFYLGTCIQGRRHLVIAATSVQSCAYRSLWVTMKLDSAAI